MGIGTVSFVLLVASCASGPPPAPPATPLQSVAPRGSTDWPFAFTWRGASVDAVVRVRVYDDAERAIYGIEARGAEAPAPEDLRRQLKPGTTYQWRVARVDENGQETDQSELTEFSVR